MNTSQPKKRLGYWLSLKKSKKLSLPDIESSLRARDIEPIKIDLEKSLAEQGPFDGILHKLTDYIAKAELGDQESDRLIRHIQEYVYNNPNMLMIDSIESLRTLINRFKTYNIIDKSTSCMQDKAFVPKFIALYSNDLTSNTSLLRDAKVSYPAVCKPIIAHGLHGHQMTLIFNEKGLDEVTFPCVVQSFVNHGAVLYKLFAIGEKYFLIERPSIKNFFNCSDYEAIHFDGNEVSKANSVSVLNVQESIALDEEQIQLPSPCSKALELIVREIGKAMSMCLFGVDVVVESSTGRYAIVDVNAFPGYDGVADFSEELADYIKQELDKKIPQDANCTKEREEPSSRLIK